jgi:DNA-binding NarL/FixJ family response regulator
VKPRRILLAVKPALFRDSLHAMLARFQELRVFDSEPWSVEILVAARRHQVDVVVLSLQASPGIPPLVARLLAELPGIRIVSLDLEAECVRIHRYGRGVRAVPCPGGSELIRAIIGEA